MTTRTSGWLRMFRRNLRRDEAATPETLTAPTDAPTAAHSPVMKSPVQQPAPPIHPHEAVLPAQPVVAQPAPYPAPQYPAATHWPAAAATVPPTPMAMPFHDNAGPAYPQAPVPAEFPSGYPTHHPVHAQQMMFHAPVPAMQPYGYPQGAPAFVHPAYPSAPQFVPSMAAMPLYQPALPAFPYPVAANAQAPVNPAHAAYAAPFQPQPIRQELVHAGGYWDDEERDHSGRGEVERLHARTVEELREDLREFRAALLDLAESRARRRYG